MPLVAIYEIRCPSGHTIELPETILEGNSASARVIYGRTRSKLCMLRLQNCISFRLSEQGTCGTHRRTASNLRVPRIERSKRMR